MKKTNNLTVLLVIHLNASSSVEQKKNYNTTLKLNIDPTLTYNALYETYFSGT